MELEEALYFQRRQELQRDLQLRQMLLQGQIDRQQNMHQQRMHELQQQFGTQQALANLQREQQNQQLQEQLLRRRQLGLAAATQLPHAASAARPPGSLIMSAPLGSPIQIRRPSTRDVIMADALTSNATRRPANSGKRKRASSATSDNSNGDRPAGRRARKNSVSSQKASHHNDALLLAEASMGNMNSKPRARSNSKTPSPALLPQYSEEAQAVEAFKALSAVPARDSPFAPSPVEEFVPIVKGTIDSLIEAGQSEKKINDASAVLLTLQDVGELSESEPEPELLDSDVYEVGDASDLAVKIDLPGFQSRLPQLPCEPELRDSLSENKSPSKPSPEKKPTEDIEMGKEQDVANGDKQESPGKKDAEAKEASPAKKGSPAKINGDKAKASDVIQPLEYPYPIDTWWPSIPTIRRERKLHGEDADDDKFVDDTSVFPQDSEFHGDVRQIRSRLSTDVQPGVLEKIPHCKIHRLRIKGKKGLNVPDHAFCWQVSEAYCNDVMVCCSICSTWRHAGCGGHYKAISVREQIESKQPFTPICDLCHAEQALLQEYPKGEARLERQRIEQLRRALSTTAIIRQAPFVKFGGTYKWPLGSVSNSHIGGHTRSIHSRHDKAEKTWTEMTNRLSRGAGYRPKERVKVRTKEFERVLVCVEDSGTLFVSSCGSNAIVLVSWLTIFSSLARVRRGYSGPP